MGTWGMRGWGYGFNIGPIILVQWSEGPMVKVEYIRSFSACIITCITH